MLELGLGKVFSAGEPPCRVGVLQTPMQAPQIREQSFGEDPGHRRRHFWIFLRVDSLAQQAVVVESRWIDAKEFARCVDDLLGPQCDVVMECDVNAFPAKRGFPLVQVFVVMGVS